MAFNPFQKRATEHLREDTAYLGVVSPKPIRHFLLQGKDHGILYDRLVTILGTPGSGKTTMARLFEFRIVFELLSHANQRSYRPLIQLLADSGAIEDLAPKILGARLALESDYRDIWELPYSSVEKSGLLFSFVQSRSVLTWLRMLEDADISLSDVKIVAQDPGSAAAQSIGGVEAASVQSKARDVESCVYEIVASLAPPPFGSLSELVTQAYKPFDVIEAVEIPWRSAGSLDRIQLQPLVMFDDAHCLHPKQFESLKNWMSKRELRIARWFMSRLDVLKPQESLDSRFLGTNSAGVELPGVTEDRDEAIIRFQGHGESRLDQRKKFRYAARDITKRALNQIAMFSEKGMVDLPIMLEEAVREVGITASAYSDLKRKTETLRRKKVIADRRLEEFRGLAKEFLEKKGTNALDIEEAMIQIMAHRYANRTPQQELWDDDDPEPSKPIRADNDVYEGARTHLHLAYGRPLYYGFDTLCDAASQNTELFLRLADVFVESLEFKLARKKDPGLTPEDQDKKLRIRSKEIIKNWAYPDHDLVRKLCEGIGHRCMKRSAEENAPLGPGANAYGILQEEYDQLQSDDSRGLARALHFGIAYNAFAGLPNYECKKKKWFLLELGGCSIISHGLTFLRGGFVEGSLSELEGFISTK